MFAVPLTAGALALPGSYVTIIASTYGDAAPVLMVLSVDALVIVLSNFFGSVLYGVETVDEEGKLSLRRLTRSRMFIAFSLPYLHSAFTLPTSFYVLTMVVQDQPLLAALYIVIINASARFAMFLIQYVVVRGMVKIDIPWKSIGKYVFAAAAMGVILYMLPHPSSRLYTLAETGAGGLIYLALIMAIDKDARRLGRETLRKIRHRLKDFSQ
jgi:hypothetical protein